MPTFVIHGQEPKEETMRLALVDRGDTIMLRAVDARGEKIHCGNILYLKKSTGVIYLSPACGVSGIVTEEGGHAKVVKG